MAQQGLMNNGASSQCYCGANHAQGNAGTARDNSQPANTVFQGGLPTTPESDIISTIKTIVNELSNTLSFARVSSNSGSQAENVTQNTATNNTTGNDSTDQANNESLDDFIISLIEQLLATLEGLMGAGDNSNSENNPPASGNNPSTPTTPVISIDPSTILDNSVANESGGEVSNYDEMTQAEQKLVAQLYELIAFMTDVGDNLEETGNSRISSLIGYLEQQLDEEWHRTRHDNMLYALIQFLERYKDR
jgi:hypothetical protein